MALFQATLRWEQIVQRVVKTAKDRNSADLEWLGRRDNWWLVKAVFVHLDLQHLLHVYVDVEEWSSTGISEILYLLGGHQLDWIRTLGLNYD